MQTLYTVNDSLVPNFDPQEHVLIDFLEKDEEEFHFSELDKINDLFDSVDEKYFGKMKIETSPVIVLDTFKVLRSKACSSS